MSRRQGRYWICTIPAQDADRETLVFPYALDGSCAYVCGQLEEGQETGYLHWQVMAIFKRKVSIRSLQQSFCEGGHYELSRSEAARSYVGKEETRVGESFFELGTVPFKSNSGEDWDRVWECARNGRFMDIPSNIRVIKTLIRFVIILPLERSALILRDQLQIFVECWFTGDQQVLVKLEELGMREGWMLTLRCPVPNFGMVIRVKKLLSSMSLEEILESPIYSDGLIGILALWKSRGVAQFSVLSYLSLPRTFIQENGIPPWTLKPSSPLSEDWK